MGLGPPPDKRASGGFSNSIFSPRLKCFTPFSGAGCLAFRKRGILDVCEFKALQEDAVAD
jgi:hypothetical protein